MGNHRGLLQEGSGRTHGKICTCLSCLGEVCRSGAVLFIGYYQEAGLILDGIA